MAGRSSTDYLDTIPNRSLRSPGQSSDAFSTATKSAIACPPPADPPPAYVAPTEAADLVSGELDRYVAVSDGALNLVNGFLDQVLYTLLATSHSLSLGALRTAVPMVLKPRLGKAALTAADEELNDYLEDSDVTALKSGNAVRDLRNEFPLDDAWKLARLRCMVYARLGDMEEEDEETFLENSDLAHYAHLSREGAEHPAIITPAAAIFTTAVLEFLAEQALCLAGQHAERRQRTHGKSAGIETLTIQDDEEPDQVLLLETDMFHVGREGPLSRLWRNFRKHSRAATDGAFSRPMTPNVAGILPASSPAHSRNESHTSQIATISEERSPPPDLPQNLVLVPQVSPDKKLKQQDGLILTSLPVVVEVPKEAPVVPERSRKRPVSLHTLPDTVLDDLRTPSTAADANPILLSEKGRSRSQSLPHGVFLPGIGYIGRPVQEDLTSQKPLTSVPTTASTRAVAGEPIKEKVSQEPGADPTSAAGGSISEVVTGAVTAIAGALGVGAIAKTSSEHAQPTSVDADKTAKQAKGGKTASPVETSDPEDLALSSQDEEEKNRKRQSYASAHSRTTVPVTATKSVERDSDNVANLRANVHPDSEDSSVKKVPTPVNIQSPLPINTAFSPRKTSVRNSFASIQTIGSDQPAQSVRSSSSIVKPPSPRLTMQPVTQPNSPNQFVHSTHNAGFSDTDAADTPSSKRQYIRLRGDPDGHSLASSKFDDDNEARKKDLDSLINSGETLHYTLTPQSARDDAFNLTPSKPTTTRPQTSTEATRPISNGAAYAARSPPPTRDLVNGSRSHPPDMSTGSMTSQSRKVIPSSANIVRQTSTGPKRRNPLGEPREARAERNTTRDLADYARSTGPADSNQLPKALSANPRPATAAAAAPTTARRSSSQSRFQARDPRPARSAETADLARFIREGPPAGTPVSRTVPGVYLPDATETLPLAGSTRVSGHSSQTSAQESALTGKSAPSSLNSHTPLLESSGTMGVNAHGTPKVPSMIPEGNSVPKVNRGKARDPYSIDYSDDESDEDLMPAKPRGQEESLIDFLRNTAPPPEMLTQPILSSGALQDHPTIQKAISSPRLHGSFTGGSDSDRRSGSLRRTSSSARERSPHLTKSGSKFDKYRPTQTTHAAHVERNRRSRVEAREARGNPSTGGSRELAEFLRSTGPPAYSEHHGGSVNGSVEGDEVNREPPRETPKDTPKENKENVVTKFFGRKGSFLQP